MRVKDQLPILGRRSHSVAIVHLGVQKTGTTYLQSLLKGNREWLARDGITYPAGCNEIGFAHHSLVQALQGSNNAAMQYYEQVFAAPGHLIISSEGLHTLSTEQLRELRSMLAPRDAYAVLYFRNPVKWLRSCWVEHTKHGYAMTVSRYLSVFEKGAAFDEIAARVASAFGRDRTIFVSYDDLLATATDTLVFFLSSIVGLSIPTDFDWSKAYPNDSLGSHGEEINRALNAVLRSRGIHPGTASFHFLLRSKPGSAADQADIERYFERVTIPNDLQGLNEMTRRLTARYRGNFVNIEVDEGGAVFPGLAPMSIDSAVLDRALTDPPFVRQINALADDCLLWCERRGIALRTVSEVPPEP